jgi:RNA recognition motif-containing protein
MSTKEQTINAAEALDGAEWMGRELTVRIAKPHEITNLEPDEPDELDNDEEVEMWDDIEFRLRQNRKR